MDTARLYGSGSSETMLGELKCKERGLLIGTKYLPMFLHSIPKIVTGDDWGTILPSFSASLPQNANAYT